MRFEQTCILLEYIINAVTNSSLENVYYDQIPIYKYLIHHIIKTKNRIKTEKWNLGAPKEMELKQHGGLWEWGEQNPKR